MFRLNRVKSRARGDEQRFVILAAEADVGGPVLRHGDVLNLLSGLVEPRHVPGCCGGGRVGTDCC